MPRFKYRFKDGMLYVGAPNDMVYRLCLWPYPRAQKARKGANRWEYFYPEERVVYPPYSEDTKMLGNRRVEQLEMALDLPPLIKKREGFELLRKALPPSYAKALQSFQTHQWNPLALLSFEEAYFDLLQSSPALAYYLANHKPLCFDLFRERKTYLPKVLRMKQTELMDMFILPRTKQMAKIVRKIIPEAVNDDNIFELQKAVRHPEALKVLSHVKVINTGVLEVIGQPIRVLPNISMNMIEEISADKGQNRFSNINYQVDHCLRLHEKMHADCPFKRLESLADLEQRVQELMAEEFVRNREKYKGIVFDEPPFKGTKDIIPISTGEELYKEGQQQRHCVASYCSEIQRGGGYVYRVMKPERCTLYILPFKGRWQIREVQKKCNADVADETLDVIQDWLDSGQGLL